MFCPIIWQEQFCSCDQVWVNQINCLINSSCWVTQSEMILGWVWAAHRSLKGGWMMWSDTDTPAGVEETNSQVVKRGGMWQGLGAVLGDVRASWVTVAWRQRRDWGSGFRQHLATRGDPKLGQVASPQTACFGAVTSVNPHPDSWLRRALRDTPVCPARWGLQWLVGTDKEHNENTLCLSHRHWGLLCGCAHLHQNSWKCCSQTQIVSASNGHCWSEGG